MERIVKIYNSPDSFQIYFIFIIHHGLVCSSALECIVVREVRHREVVNMPRVTHCYYGLLMEAHAHWWLCSEQGKGTGRRLFSGGDRTKG